jgi:HEAT repeat protein
MRHVLVTSLALLALTRVEPAVGGGPMPAKEVRDLLGAIDFVPTIEMIDGVMGASAADDLAELAADPATDAGVRLRAIHALARYPSDDSRTTLYAVIATLGAATAGADALLLRAAIEALGEIGGPDAVATITPFLAVGSTPDVCAGMRDVRATAAEALRVIGSPTAVPALRARQVEGSNKEPCEQVSLAITEALRDLLGG